MTLDVDEDKIAQALELTGLRTKTACIDAALDALIQRAAALRLAELGGAFPHARAAPRRKAGGRKS
jgi:Arc/MetJ family transcription regulator